MSPPSGYLLLGNRDFDLDYRRIDAAASRNPGGPEAMLRQRIVREMVDLASGNSNGHHALGYEPGKGDLRDCVTAYLQSAPRGLPTSALSSVRLELRRRANFRGASCWRCGRVTGPTACMRMFVVGWGGVWGIGNRGLIGSGIGCRGTAGVERRDGRSWRRSERSPTRGRVNGRWPRRGRWGWRGRRVLRRRVGRGGLGGRWGPGGRSG